MASRNPAGKPSNAPSKLRKPVFVKVDQLQPGTSGHTLTVKVVSSKTVMQRARPIVNNVRSVRIAECVVGDETGTIVFTARNEQGVCSCLLSQFYPSNFVCILISLCGQGAQNFSTRKSSTLRL